MFKRLWREVTDLLRTLGAEHAIGAGGFRRGVTHNKSRMVIGSKRVCSWLALKSHQVRCVHAVPSGLSIRWCSRRAAWILRV